MNTYHKINTIFKRDMTNKGKIMEGTYSDPEFEYLKENIWTWTEKVDGTNIRVMWNGEDVVFSGKTDAAQIPAFLVTRLNDLFYKTEKKQIFKEIFIPKEGEEMRVCLYGEGYGAKIQGGGGNYKSDGVDFVLIDVKVGEIWLKREDVQDIANKFGIGIVPIIGEGTLADMVEKVKTGFNSQWGNFLAEGIVARPKVELRTRMGHRVIVKLKHKDFI